MINTKKDIISALETSFEEFALFIDPLAKQEFEDRPGDKWSAGQQLDHLIRSVKPLNLAFSLPAFIFPILFGKMNRTARDYDELKDKYYGKLAGGGKASAQFIPPAIGYEQKEQKRKTYLKEKEKLQKKVNRFTEGQLDSILLPHPLLGKLTVREMMFFTIFHTEHHLHTLKSRQPFLE